MRNKMSGDNNFSFAPVTQKAHVSISRTDHSQSMMKSVDDIFQKQLFTDVVLSCENQIINAHRLILAASSSFFYSLFNSQPTCLTVNPVIIIRDVKINELKAILEFIYYGTTTFAETEINNLIKSADALGVLGLSKINPDQIKEKLKEDDEEQQEINNNTLNNSENQLSQQKDSPSTSKEQTNKSINDLDKSSKSKNNQSASSLINNNKNNSDKNKRRLLNRQTVSDTEEEQSRENDKELEEKRKKKEILNQNLINNQQNLLQQQTTTTLPSSTTIVNNNNTDQQSSSKRQSLRIRCRKDNLETTQTNQESAKQTLDLNTSNNSNVSLGDLISTNGNKRLKVRSEDEEELMSIDGSQYNNSNNLIQKETQLDKQLESTNDTNNRISTSFKEKTLKLKRNKNSILKKQDSSLINSNNKRQTNELIDSQSNSNQSDDIFGEEIILKKLDSLSTSLNTSRKNSVDSNHDELIVNKFRTDKNNELNNQSNSLLATTSTFSKQQTTQQQKKKKRKISIDANS